MRVSTNMRLTTNQINIGNSYGKFVEAQQVVATGKKLNKPSDDPAGIAEALNIQSVLDRITQYQSNINQASAFMGVTDTALGNGTTLLRQARTLALQSASSTISTEQLQNISDQVREITKQMVAIGNSTYGSRYVFGGQISNKPPYVIDTTGAVTYQGGTSANNSDNLVVEIAQGDKMNMNVTGDQAFGQIFTTLNKLVLDIQTGNTQEISNSDIAAIDKNLQAIITSRSSLGSRVQRLNTSLARLATNQTSITELLSNVEDADMAKAALALQSAQLTYQGALAAGARGYQTSLLDFIK